ncbi:hypothetical protein MLD38_008978 [Melastoma candidum]|uniref:Uncharacterized protein n=1 Tax=Melastoma candidum TaxID=119954 RepID=A0ACB9RVI5_9MYRT|nr:hypothetical protein MLD38_008978 [Melastoma candidum]
MEEDDGPITRRWEDLGGDALVRIFQSFDVFDLTSGIAHVCRAWRSACCDPLLWKILDLSSMESNFIRIPQEPYIYVDGRSDKTLMKVLKLVLSLSRGNIQTIIFNFNLYVSDDQLLYTAERCPLVRRLVMPAWNRIKKTGICKAISTWPYLESMTMPSIGNPPYLLEEIARSCKNFKELKIMGPFEVLFASSLVKNIPNLEVLSLRCSMVNRDALRLILDGLHCLKALNLSHSVVVEICPHKSPKRVFRGLDPEILQKASRLQEFYVCMEEACVMCQRARCDEGLMRWYKYEPGLWKYDEVCSLAL